MARVRSPYWLPGSARNWLVCNFICAGIIEIGFRMIGVPWPRHFPVTSLLGGSLAVWGVLHFLGRTALVEFEDTVRWHPARIPEPGEPPPGNRLAWPLPGDAAPRVATPAARALTVRKRHSPRDRGEGHGALVTVPVVGFLVALLASLLFGGIGLAYKNNGILYAWAAWVAIVWVCITVSVIFKTRRLNEDA